MSKRCSGADFGSPRSGHKKCNASKMGQQLIFIDHTRHDDYAYHQRLLTNKRLSDETTDIKFIVENEEIPAHRPVIEILKDKRQLVKNAIERDRKMARMENTEEANIFQMSGTTVTAFRQLLVYIYTGIVECDLSTGIELATTAHKLKFHPLVATLAQQLAQYKAQCLSVATVDDLYHIGKSADNKDLLKACAKYLDDKSVELNRLFLKRDVQSKDANNVLTYTLDRNRFMNYIHFLLPEDTEICFTLSVSSDRNNWTTVLKNTEIYSKFWNWVYFEERRIKYIRFCLTDSSDPPFNMRDLKDEHVLCKRSNIELEFQTIKDTTYLVPKHDVIKFPIKNTKYVFDTELGSYTYCTSIASAKDKGEHYYYHNINDGNFLEFFLSQPCLIDSFRFHLWDEDKRTYDFRVEIKSEDEEEYCLIKDNNNDSFVRKSSWQTIHLRSRRPVRWIRITGTKGPHHDNEFAIIDFECPAIRVK